MENIESNEEKIENIKVLEIKKILVFLMYFMFGMYMGVQIFKNTVMSFYNVEMTVKVIENMCYTYFIIKAIIDCVIYKKVPILAIPVIIITLIINKYTGRIFLLYLIFMIIASRGCNIRKMIKIVLYIYSVIFVFTICLALTGMIPDWTYLRNLKDSLGKLRHSLGFIYPTNTIGFYFTIVLMYSYVREQSITKIELLILQLINGFLYVYTDGRLGFYLITMVLIAVLLYKYFKSIIIEKILKNKCIKTICCTMPIIFFVLMLLMSYLYGMGINGYLDGLLSGRLKYSYNALVNYEMKPFGDLVRWYGLGGYGYIFYESYDDYISKYNYVDSSYVKMLFDYGIVISSIILIAYSFLIKKIIEKKDYLLLFIIMITLVRAFMEPYIVAIEHNVFLLAFSMLLENREKIISEKFKE